MNTLPEAEAERVRVRLREINPQLKAIVDAADGRSLTKAQAADFRPLHEESVRLRTALGQPPAEAFYGTDGGGAVAKKLSDDLEAWMQAPQGRLVSLAASSGGGYKDHSDDFGFRKEDGSVRVLKSTEHLTDLVPPASPGAELSAGRFVKAIVTGNWKGIDPQAKAQSVGLGSGGGYLAPDALSARVIDRARAESVLIRAGAGTVPMETAELAFGRLASAATSGWKSENASITAGDLTFERVVLRAKTLVALVKSSVELIEDAPNVSDTIEGELSKALALELDRAGMFGTGAANEPLGIVNQVGIGTTAVSGALTRFTNVGTAVLGVKAANHDPNFLALAPRTWGFFDALADTTNQPLLPPESWKQLVKLTSTAVPITLGGGSDTTLIVGRGEEMIFGVRTGLTIEASRQAADSSGSAFGDLQVWIRCYLRADFALLHPAAFHTLSGVSS